MHTVVSLEVALALEFLVRFCVVNEVQPVNNNNNNNNNSNSNNNNNNSSSNSNSSNNKKKKTCLSYSTTRPTARPRSN